MDRGNMVRRGRMPIGGARRGHIERGCMCMWAIGNCNVGDPIVRHVIMSILNLVGCILSATSAVSIGTSSMACCLQSGGAVSAMFLVSQFDVAAIVDAEWASFWEALPVWEADAALADVFNRVEHCAFPTRYPFDCRFYGIGWKVGLILRGWVTVFAFHWSRNNHKPMKSKETHPPPPKRHEKPQQLVGAKRPWPNNGQSWITLPHSPQRNLPCCEVFSHSVVSSTNLWHQKSLLVLRYNDKPLYAIIIWYLVRRWLVVLIRHLFFSPYFFFCLCEMQYPVVKIRTDGFPCWGYKVGALPKQYFNYNTWVWLIF